MPKLKTEIVSPHINRQLFYLRWFPVVGALLWFILLPNAPALLIVVAAIGAVYNTLSFALLWVLPERLLEPYTVGMLVLDVVYGVSIFAASGGEPLALILGGVFPGVTAWVCFERVGGLLATVTFGLAGVLLHLADGPDVLLYGIGVLVILIAGISARRLNLVMRIIGPPISEVEAAALRLRAARQRARTTFEMTSKLTGTLDPQGVLESMLELSASGLSSIGKSDKLVACAMVFEAGDELAVAVSRGLIRRDVEVRLPGKAGAIAQAMQETRPIFTAQPDEDPELLAFAAFKSCRSVWCIPLSAGFDRFGVLIIGTDKPNAFSDEEVELLSAIGTQATIALKNARLYLDLQEEKERIRQVGKKAREQLSNDLEQGPTQTVSTVATQTNLVRRMLDRTPDEVPDKLVWIEDMTRQGVKEIRHFLFALRPLALEAQGLAGAMEQLVDKMQDTYGQEVQLEIEEGIEELLSDQAQNTLFYICYEALNVIRKHDVSHPVKVNIRKEPEALIFEIITLGQYFTGDQLGRRDLQERANLIQGVLDIHSAHKGTCIQTFIPFDSKHVAGENGSEVLHHAGRQVAFTRLLADTIPDETKVDIANPGVDKLLFYLRWLPLFVALVWYILISPKPNNALLVIIASGALYNLFLPVIMWVLPDMFNIGLAFVTLVIDSILGVAFFFTTAASLVMLLVGSMLPVITAWVRFGWIIGLVVTLAPSLATIFVYMATDSATVSPSDLSIYGLGVFVLFVAGLTGERLYWLLRTFGPSLSKVEQEVHSLRAVQSRTRATFEITSTLGVSLDLQSVLEAACQLVTPGLCEEAEDAELIGCLLLYEGRRMFVAAQCGLHRDDYKRQTPGHSGMIALAMRQNEPVLLKDARDDPELRRFKTLRRCRSILCLPLRAGYDDFGVIILAMEPPDMFDEEQTDLFYAISTQSTIALKNTTLYNNLQEEKNRIVQVDKEARATLARDLHDGPTQTVSAVAMRLNVIRMMLKKQPGEVHEELYKVEGLTRQAIKEIRGFLNALSPIALETHGFAGALRQLAETINDTYKQNVLVQVQPNAEAMLSPEAKDAFYNIMIEAVNNARKHAEADHIWVRLYSQPEGIVFEIEDDGKGFDYEETMATYLERESQSLGMFNLRDRAKLVNGEFHMQSAIGKGTKIQVFVSFDTPHANRI